MNSSIIIKEIEFVIKAPEKETPRFQMFSNRQFLQTFKELIPIFTNCSSSSKEKRREHFPTYFMVNYKINVPTTTATI